MSFVPVKAAGHDAMHDHDPVGDGNYRDGSLSRNRKVYCLVFRLEICIIWLNHTLHLHCIHQTATFYIFFFKLLRQASTIFDYRLYIFEDNYYHVVVIFPNHLNSVSTNEVRVLGKWQWNAVNVFFKIKMECRPKLNEKWDKSATKLTFQLCGVQSVVPLRERSNVFFPGAYIFRYLIQFLYIFQYCWMSIVRLGLYG